MSPYMKYIKIKKSDISTFYKQVLAYWKTHGRHHLPWRHTDNPYHILVSEMMLQQTQVDRVIPKYKAFLRIFPSVDALSKSNFRNVLTLWSGLGYNRRAKFLHESARIIAKEYQGVVPQEKELLTKLPGIGEYTASAIRVFAFNEKEILIETNIRTALIHHFFSSKRKVEDTELVMVLERILPEVMSAREWYSALMDYGTYIKQEYGNATQKSSGYKKQSAFKGSLREVRGAVLRELQKETPKIKALPFTKDRVEKALSGLERDAIVVSKNGRWEIA